MVQRKQMGEEDDDNRRFDSEGQELLEDTTWGLKSFSGQT